MGVGERVRAQFHKCHNWSMRSLSSGLEFQTALVSHTIPREWKTWEEITFHLSALSLGFLSSPASLIAK